MFYNNIMLLCDNCKQHEIDACEAISAGKLKESEKMGYIGSMVCDDCIENNIEFDLIFDEW